jgi:hypothetical protein
VIRFLAVNPVARRCVKVLRPHSGLSQSVASEVLCARAAMFAHSTSEQPSGDGMSLTSLTEDSRNNPLDVVERLAAGHQWSFERAGDEEITILIGGRWTDYQLAFTWMFGIEALHLACAFDFRVPERRRPEVQQLISLINEQLWVGHFDLWTADGMVMYRHALVLAGGVEASNQQCEALLTAAVDGCERYFPAFQFVVWAGKSAREALDAAMFDTSGQA